MPTPLLALRVIATPSVGSPGLRLGRAGRVAGLRSSVQNTNLVCFTRVMAPLGLTQALPETAVPTRTFSLVSAVTVPVKMYSVEPLLQAPLPDYGEPDRSCRRHGRYQSSNQQYQSTHYPPSPFGYVAVGAQSTINKQRLDATGTLKAWPSLLRPECAARGHRGAITSTRVYKERDVSLRPRPRHRYMSLLQHGNDCRRRHVPHGAQSRRRHRSTGHRRWPLLRCLSPHRWLGQVRWSGRRTSGEGPEVGRLHRPPCRRQLHAYGMRRDEGRAVWNLPSTHRPSWHKYRGSGRLVTGPLS